jgi:hypothetical protein
MLCSSGAARRPLNKRDQTMNMKNHVRRTILVAAVASSAAIALGAVGTAQAGVGVPQAEATDDDSTTDESSLITCRKAGGDQLGMRKSGGDPQSIIAIL